MALIDDILKKALEGKVATNSALDAREEPFRGRTSLVSTSVTGLKDGFPIGAAEDTRFIGNQSNWSLYSGGTPNDEPIRHRRLVQEQLFYGFDVYAEGITGRVLDATTFDTRGCLHASEIAQAGLNLGDLRLIISNRQGINPATGLAGDDSVKRYSITDITGYVLTVDTSDGNALPPVGAPYYEQYYWQVGIRRPVDLWPLPDQWGETGNETTWLCAKPLVWPVVKTDTSVQSLSINGTPARLKYELVGNFGGGGGQPLDTETVTIDGKVYQFQTTLTDVDGNVQIGPTRLDSLQNLHHAINLTGTPGTDYAASMTAHPTVFSTSASGTGGISTLYVAARVAGGNGNLINVSTTVTAGRWEFPALRGGSNAMQEVPIEGMRIMGQVSHTDPGGQVLTAGDWVATFDGKGNASIYLVAASDFIAGSPNLENIALTPFFNTEVVPAPSFRDTLYKIHTVGDFFPLGSSATGSPLNDRIAERDDLGVLDQIWVRNLIGPVDAHPEAMSAASGTMYEHTPVGRPGYALTIFTADAVGNPDLTNPISKFDGIVIDPSVTEAQEVRVDYQNGLVRLSHPIADGGDLNPNSYRDADGRVKLWATFVAQNENVAPYASAELVARPRGQAVTKGASSRIHFNDAPTGPNQNRTRRPIDEEPGWVVDLPQSHPADLFHATVDPNFGEASRNLSLGISSYRKGGTPVNDLGVNLKFQTRHPHSNLYHLGQLGFGRDGQLSPHGFMITPDAIDEADAHSLVYHVPRFGVEGQPNLRITPNRYVVYSADAYSWPGTVMGGMRIDFIINDIPVSVSLGNQGDPVPMPSALAAILDSAVISSASNLGILPGNYSITVETISGEEYLRFEADHSLVFTGGTGHWMFGLPDDSTYQYSTGIALGFGTGDQPPSGELLWDKTENTLNWTGAKLQVNGRDVLGSFGTPAEALAATSEDSFVVRGGRPFEAMGVALTGPNNVFTPIAICAERLYLVASVGGNWEVHAYRIIDGPVPHPDFFSAPVWTVAVTSVAPPTYLKTDGHHLVYRDGGDTKVVAADTGTPVRTISNNGETVVAIDIARGFVFRALVNSTSTSWTLDTTHINSGNNWSETLNYAVYDIAYIVKGHGLGEGYLAVIHATDGNGDELSLWEGGFGNPVLAQRAWAVDIATMPGAQVVTDGRFIYVWRGDTNAVINAYAIGNGALVWSTNVGSATGGSSLACDATSVYLVKDDEHEMFVLDSRSGSLLRTPIPLQGSPLGTPIQITPVVSNSHSIAVLYDDTISSKLSIMSIRTNIGTRLWERNPPRSPFLQAAPEVL